MSTVTVRIPTSLVSHRRFPTRIPRFVLAACLALSATAAPGLSGCGSDGGNGPGGSLAGDWQVTSFVAQGTDAIANGMTFAMTLSAGGTYTFDVTNDLVGICDPNPDCTATGTYSQAGGMITFDPGTVDEVVLNVSLQGNTATLTGSISGNAVTITLTRI